MKEWNLTCISDKQQVSDTVSHYLLSDKETDVESVQTKTELKESETWLQMNDNGALCVLDV